MNLSRAQIAAVLVSVIVIFAISWKCYHYTEQGYAPAYPENIVSSSLEISADELKAFLKTIRRYRQEKINELEVSDLAMSAEASLSEANPEVARWLRRKGWNAERFFYIENRVRTILATIARDKEIAKNRRLMLEQAQLMEDKELAEVLLKNAEEQNKKFNIERISADEYQMILPQKEEISALLENGKVN